MRTAKRLLVPVSVALAFSCAAEEFEVGAAGGYAFYRNPAIARDNLSGTAGFGRGALFSVLGGHEMTRYLSGEVRYTLRDSPLSVESGGTEVSFAGRGHLVHYDAIVHTRPAPARFRPFIAFGGGIKIYEGTGMEVETQPLSRLAILTRTRELLPLASVGAGLRFRIARHALFRADFRDYITPFPKRVVMPAPGTKSGGWLHDLTPMIGISAVF